MCKKLNFLIVLCIALCLAGDTANADLSDGLVVLHSFDDHIDGSGNGLDLILEGDAYLEDGLLYVGGDGYADIGSFEAFSAVNPLIVDGETSEWSVVIAYSAFTSEWGATILSIGPDSGDGTGDFNLFVEAEDIVYIDHWWVEATDSAEIPSADEIAWLVVTYMPGDGYTFYSLDPVDGTPTELAGGDMDYSGAWDTGLDYGARLGFPANEILYADEDWFGWFEGQYDYFAMWNRVLDEEEMPEVVDFGTGPPSGKAGNPDPGNGDDFVDREPELSWNPGAFAVKHNVYFGTDFDDVNEADTDSPLLVSTGQIDTTYTLVEILDWGGEYFWRIDEINDADPNSPWKGATWSFIVEPYAYVLDPEEDQYQYADYEVEIHASSVANEDTWADATVWDGVEDGIQNTEVWTMWLSDIEPDGMAWIVFPFDKAYQLMEMDIWNYNEDVEPDLGFGFKETVIEYTTDDLTADDITWVELMTVNLNPAPGVDTPATDTLDLQSTLATGLRLTAKSNQSGFNDQFGLSSVRIHYLPIRAMDPVPEPEEFVELDDLVLEWRAGREATSHKVYLGTDEEDLPLVDTIDETSYKPEGLELDTEYFWRIDETDDPALAGAVWSFITNAFLTIDDMESYEDSLDDPDIAIWGTWADGAGEPTNGSLVGYDFGETEKDITHDDSDQSMPLTYDNTGDAVISEATRTYDEVQNWTRSEVKALTLYFHGSEDNIGGQMFIKVNGVEQAITVDLTDESWQEVNIDLADFAGVDLENITSMTIGIKGAGSSGIMFIDNIRLYPSRCLPGTDLQGDINGDCIVDEEDLVIIANNWLGTPMHVEYTFDADLSDTSGNGRDGVGVDGPVVQGGVLTLDGTNFVDIPLGADNPFDGSQDFSIALDFQAETPSLLFSSARDDEPDNHAMSIFVHHWDEEDYAEVIYDQFYIGGAGSGDNPLDGEWHSVVVTYSVADELIRVYLDGEPGWDGEWNPEIPDIADDTVRIGGSLNSVYPYDEGVENLVGSIDNLRVFSFVLTEDDAAELPDSIPAHPADLNGDGIVDQADKDIVEDNLGAEEIWP